MPETLTQAVREAVAAMPWLAPSDGAAVDLALTYAAQIDAVMAEGDSQSVTRALYLGPHLLNTLRAIGGTPLERKVLDIDEPAGGKLAQLKAEAERLRSSRRSA